MATPVTATRSATEASSEATRSGRPLRPGDAVRFAREAAETGADVVVAAGGDGTLNEVVRGVDEADALDRVAVGVVPVGTGNDFAENVDVPSIDEAFAALDADHRRRIDLGRANGRVFVNSCVAGLTADASAATSPELKKRFGVLAYLIAGIRSVATYEGLPLSITVSRAGKSSPAWSGKALCVLVGNGRHFSMQGSAPANMEDGRFDVMIIDDVPAFDLMSDAVAARLLDREASHNRTLSASALEITGQRPTPITFSLDGEIIQTNALSLDVEPRTLEFFVGPDYEPEPGT